MRLPQRNRKRMCSIGRYVAQLTLAALVVIQIYGCAMTPLPVGPALPEPRSGPVHSFESKHPVVALVLSGALPAALHTLV